MPVSSVPRPAFATALFITTIELAVLLVALSPRRRAVQQNPAPVVEHVEFVVPARSPARIAAQRVSTPRRSDPLTASAPRPGATLVVPRDSSTGAPSPRAAPARALTPPAGATADGGAVVGPVLAPRGVYRSAPLTRRVIDSVLDSLNANMPALIWARVPTRAERDAAYKEGALAMRLSGRTLLVPADPHLASGFSLPSLFSRRKQREAARGRTDSILAENMERLARLRARARRDSLQRDSLRRADPLPRAEPAAAIPRRLPDARTPG